MGIYRAHQPEISDQMAKKRAYSAGTVIAAQRRVIKMALNTIGRMPRRQLLMLRACGDGGIVTLNEVSEHLVAAMHLRVRRG